MAARRGDHGIYWDTTNKCYVGTISRGNDPATGRRLRLTRRGRTKAEVSTKLDELQAELDAGIRTSSTYTVEQCVEDWLSDPALGNTMKPGTIDGNRSSAKTWIYPRIGRILIRDLKVSDLDGLFAAMGKARRRRTLAAVRSVLRRSIRRAQKHDLIEKNVVELSDLTTAVPARKSRAMTIDQARRILEETEGTRMHALFVVSFMLAVRPGEIRGLRWDHIDLDNRVIKIWRQLKNEWSERTLRVPQMVVDALKLHREIQERERENTGALWQENGLVFCHENGDPYTKEALRWRFSKVTQEAGLGHWHPHEGRHTGVSILDDNGVPIRDIADFVGHLNDTVTKKVYRHIIKPVITGGADIMDDVFK